MRKRGLEPLRDLSHYHLKVARMPIPPLPRVQNFHKSIVQCTPQIAQGQFSKDLRHMTKSPVIFSLLVSFSDEDSLQEIPKKGILLYSNKKNR